LVQPLKGNVAGRWQFRDRILKFRKARAGWAEPTHPAGPRIVGFFVSEISTRRR
jgi:hypothetical protein